MTIQIMIQDRASYPITRREYTPEGFIRVPGMVARVGIQDYLASELNLPGDPNRIVKVYRSPEEVFDAHSLESYSGADVTLNHPAGLVTSANYKMTSAGVVRSQGRQSVDFVECDLIIKDALAIKAVEGGKCELSAGYTAIYEHRPGTTKDGQAYEYVQRFIRINHVAIVDRARAGPQARILDNANSTPGAKPMPVMITNDSGRQIDVADPANANVVADAFDRLSKRAEAAEAKLATADTALQTVQAAADSANEKLAAALAVTADDAIKTRMKEVSRIQGVARKIVGDSFTTESIDSLEIMREALAIKRPAIAWASKDAAYVQCAFDMAESDVVEETEEEKKTRIEKESKDSADLLNQLNGLSQDGAAALLAASTAAKTTTDGALVLSRAQASLNARTGA